MTDINSLITKLVNSSSSSGSSRAEAFVTPTQTTAIPTPTVPVTGSLRNTAAQGWQCPVCGAVMSPWTSVCVNCHGNWSYTPKVTFDNWQVTCGSDQASCGQTTTTTTSSNT
jgi:hypothetical protein